LKTECASFYIFAKLQKFTEFPVKMNTSGSKTPTTVLPFHTDVKCTWADYRFIKTYFTHDNSLKIFSMVMHNVNLIA